MHVFAWTNVVMCPKLHPVSLLDAIGEFVGKLPQRGSTGCPGELHDGLKPIVRESTARIGCFANVLVVSQANTPPSESGKSIPFYSYVENVLLPGKGFSRMAMWRNYNNVRSTSNSLLDVCV